MASNVSASGTSVAQGAAVQRQRDRPDALRGLIAQEQPAYKLSVEREPRILDDTLEEIARYTLRLDRLCFPFVEQILAKVASGRLTSDPRTVAEAPADLINLQALIDESLLISRGQRLLHRDYLKQSSLLKFWSIMGSIARQFLRLPDNQDNRDLRNWVLASVAVLEREARALPPLISSALAEQKLDEDSRRVVRERWLAIEVIMETRATTANVTSDLMDWSSINEASRRTLKPTTSRVYLDSWPSVIFWLFFTVVIISVPTCALGLRYSDHEPGSSKDADFWFLVQNCCMGFLSLAIMSIPLIQEKLLTGHFWLKIWTYGYLVLGFSITMAAPVIYLYAPTEWSSFLTVLFSAIQVPVTWQVAVLAASKGKRT